MSTPTAEPLEAEGTRNKEVDIRVVYGQMGRHYIDLCPAFQNDSAPAAVKKLVQKHDSLVYGDWLWMKRCDVFRTTTIEIATLSPVSSPFLLTWLS
jgi:hypothetical protein